MVSILKFASMSNHSRGSYETDHLLLWGADAEICKVHVCPSFLWLIRDQVTDYQWETSGVDGLAAWVEKALDVKKRKRKKSAAEQEQIEKHNRTIGNWSKLFKQRLM